MPLNVWTQLSNTSLGTIQESTAVNIQLPVDPGVPGVVYTVITGSLPPGLRVFGSTIIGSAFEVARTTEFKFVIRAKTGINISDRTFSISVEGSDLSEWATPSGSLPVFANQHYYVLDGNYVDFQLEALDFDTAAGQTLKYFIASGDGTLPPGLLMSNTGRITGFVEPALIIPPTTGTGNYDLNLYDYVAYDFGAKSANGYDSFIYDTRSYDYGTTSLVPKKLNRNYQFVVTVTDGDSAVRRQFAIYVITDDLFRTDNTITHISSDDFTADNTYVRPPEWITPTDLGSRRADNYQTFKLDVYEGFYLGLVEYRLLNLNLDNTLSQLPPGMQFDPTSSEIFGFIPYQPALTKTYKFTISAIRYGDKEEFAVATRMFTVKIVGAIESVLSWVTPQNLGSIDANIPCTLSVQAETTLTNSQITYRVTSGELPPGLSFTLDGEIIGKPRQYSTTLDNGITTFYDDDGFGNILYSNLTYDGETTTFDRVFKFTVEAKDNSVVSASEREFSITVNLPDDRKYSNVIVKPFLKVNQRNLFSAFINDRTIFEVNTIYRPNDPNFGIQPDLKMLIYAGVETREAVDIASVLGLNHRKKRFKLGNLKKAQAKLNGDGKVLYEVVYVEIIDPLEKDKEYLPYIIDTSPDDFKITVDQTNNYYNGPFDEVVPNWHAPEPFSVTLDRTDVFASDPGNNWRFPASISLWRKRLKTLGLRQPNYLPLWMRSIQDGFVQELGYIPCIPLCYCKPGTATTVLDNIKYSGFNFQQIDYEIDRYIIDIVADYTGDKYFVFRNDRTTIS